MRKLIFCSASCLVLSACGGGPRGEHGVGRGETIVTISASGEGEAKPDTATFTAGVESFGATAEAASTANNERMAKVIVAMEGLGVAKEDVRTQSVSIGRSYYNASKRRYEASNSVSVKVRKIDDTSRIMGAATEAGANSVNGPEFTVSDPSAIQKAAITAAFKSARVRADAYASAIGMKVDRVLKIRDGAPDQNYPLAMPTEAAPADAAATAPPIRPGINTMSAQTSIDFVLK
jgi:uncharacterized protein